MKRIKKIVKLALVCFLLLLVLGFIYQRVAEQSDSKNTPAIGEVITLEQTKLHLNVSGSGDTTVLLISGAGDI